MFEGKTILITGGTGSWGQELTRKLLGCIPAEIRIFSRNEGAQVQMQRDLNEADCLSFVIGDVRDYEAVRRACEGVDYVFHLAALKHVPICERQPDEALKTNVTGTENIIRASIEAGVEKVMDVSTDKAVDPINFYGMTKAFGEKLIIRANELSTRTRFVCIRGGNVLGTNGSVVPYFKHLLAEGRNLPITSLSMTRFFLTIHEAIELLLAAAEVSIGGETFVMKMEMCRIADLANVMNRRLVAGRSGLIETGIRPGEKLHEVLISVHEAPHTHIYNEKYFVILPAHPTPALRARYGELPSVAFSSYVSDYEQMTEAEIEAMLDKGGFLG